MNFPRSAKIILKFHSKLISLTELFRFLQYETGVRVSKETGGRISKETGIRICKETDIRNSKKVASG